MISQQDLQYMALAIKLAEKGCYTTDPNPRVGCVLVKEGKVVAEGWHVRAGEDHAEIVALKQGDEVKGATAYVTLEPCSHQGRTGPCCDALISSGIKRVVVAMQDPNPLVSGKGIKKMQDAGLTVECHVLKESAELLNRGFIKRMTTGTPFVQTKLGMSLDGRTAMASGESQWITSPESRADVQYLRAKSSVILTGINTVLADDPSLNVRLDEDVTQPIRVILDSSLQMPLTAKMCQLAGETWVLTCCDDKEKKDALEKAGCQVFILAAKDNRLDLNDVMIFLGQQHINNVFVEAGAILNGALMDQKLVGEWLVYMAPCLLGDEGRGLFHLPHITTMADKKILKMTSVRQVGTDLRLTFTTH